MARTLQQQGVPFPDRLRGPQGRASQRQSRPVRRTVRDRTPLDGRMGGTRDTTTYYDYPTDNGGKVRARSSHASSLNPASLGSKAGSGIGGLEAEFLFAIVLLILLMFANSQAGYADRIMSFIKRGSLTCLLFFILALIASIGPGAARVAKVFGALMIVGILVTSPINTVFTDVDNLIKNDWVPTGETAGASGTGTSNSGTQSQTSGTSGGTVKTLTQSEIAKLLNTTIGSPAYNSFTAEIRAFKSGDVWKLPADAINTLEQTGAHLVGGAFDKLKQAIGFLGHIL